MRSGIHRHGFVLGLVMGVLVGIWTGHLAIWVGLGVVLGIVISDRQRRREVSAEKVEILPPERSR